MMCTPADYDDDHHRIRIHLASIASSKRRRLLGVSGGSTTLSVCLRPSAELVRISLLFVRTHAFAPFISALAFLCVDVCVRSAVGTSVVRDPHPTRRRNDVDQRSVSSGLKPARNSAEPIVFGSAVLCDIVRSSVASVA